MAPNGNTGWPQTALLTGSTSGPERQYRWPPKAQILRLPAGISAVIAHGQKLLAIDTTLPERGTAPTFNLCRR